MTLVPVPDVAPRRLDDLRLEDAALPHLDGDVVLGRVDRQVIGAERGAMDLQPLLGKALVDDDLRRAVAEAADQRAERRRAHPASDAAA